MSSFTSRASVESLRNYIVKSFQLEEDLEDAQAPPSRVDKWVAQYNPSISEELRLIQFLEILSEPVIDIDQLRVLAHTGVPEQVRAVVWKLLLGYLPVEKSERKNVIHSKRNEYRMMVDEVYPVIENNKSNGDELWEQIYVDVIRTFPTGIESFCESQCIRELLCRVLYVYSLKFQSGNYWQGLNEIPVPFLLTFTAFYTDCSLRQLNILPEDTISMALSSGNIEADIFWCVHNFVQALQVNGDYVVAKDGVITERNILHRFSNLCSMIDSDLKEDLKSKGVDFVFFAFRWMICLLTREIPMKAIMRLWDSYFSEGNDVLSFHLYTAISFLYAHSDEVREKPDFESTLLYVQRIPTDHWTELHAEYLIHFANQIKEMDAFYEHMTKDASSTLLVGLLESVSLSMYKDIRKQSLSQ